MKSLENKGGPDGLTGQNVSDVPQVPPDPENAALQVRPKTRRGKQGVPAPGVREILGILAVDDQLRAEVLGAFRRAGGSLDHWNAADRSLMARELTRAEDALELVPTSQARRALRLALRSVRRRLEDLSDVTP